MEDLKSSIFGSLIFIGFFAIVFILLLLLSKIPTPNNTNPSTYYSDEEKAEFESNRLEIISEIKGNIYMLCSDGNSNTKTCNDAINLCLEYKECTQMLDEYNLRNNIQSPNLITVINASKEYVNQQRKELGLSPIE